MKKKRPLSFYLATGFLIFSALLLIVLWLFQTVFLDDFYKTVKTAQVKSCAFSLSSTIKADGYNEQNASGFSELANEIETQNSMFISVYDTGEQGLSLPVWQRAQEQGAFSCFGGTPRLLAGEAGQVMFRYAGKRGSGVNRVIAGEDRGFSLCFWLFF